MLPGKGTPPRRRGYQWLPWTCAAMAPLCWIRGPAMAQKPTAKTFELLNLHPTADAIIDEDNVKAIYGAALATKSDPDQLNQVFANNYLTANGDALGVENLAWVEHGSIAISNERLEVFTYRQQIEGLPVHGTVIKVVVDTSDPDWQEMLEQRTHRFELGKRKALANAGVDLVPIRTDEDYAKALTIFFQKRNKRIRH